MADWSDLPQELLYLISLLLTSSIDILHFRSVCTSWRVAVQPPVHFPASDTLLVPLQPVSPILGEFLHVAKHTIYHLQYNNDSPPWIIKFGLPSLSHSVHLYDPLTPYLFETLPQNFPRPFSFLNLRVRELGADYRAWFPGRVCKYNREFIRKVAVLKEMDNTFVIMLANGKRHTYVLSKSGDEEWMSLRSNAVHDDVIVMGGEFYVVGNQGRQLARVNPIDSSEEIIVASPRMKFGTKKFLVECEGNLLLVEYYFHEEETSSCWFPDRVETVEVFKLDKNSGKWREVNDLGEMILFIGETCSFSASAKDVFGETSTSTGCKGNCIICWSEDLECSRVFDFKTRRFDDLDCLPDYSELFWPPPEWAYSASKIELACTNKETRMKSEATG